VRVCYFWRCNGCGAVTMAKDPVRMCQACSGEDLCPYWERQAQHDKDLESLSTESGLLFDLDRKVDEKITEIAKALSARGFKP